MTLEGVNSWLSLAANLGVVAGIFFLAVEIRQNQISLDRNSELIAREYELQVADGQIAIAEAVNRFRYLVAASDDLARIWLDGLEGRELSREENYRFMALCGALIWHGATTYNRNVALGRNDLAAAEVNVRRNQADTQPGMRRCWEANVDGLRRWGYDGLIDAVSN